MATQQWPNVCRSGHGAPSYVTTAITIIIFIVVAVKAKIQ